jgi:hypothetical protein
MCDTPTPCLRRRIFGFSKLAGPGPDKIFKAKNLAGKSLEPRICRRGQEGVWLEFGVLFL